MDSAPAQVGVAVCQTAAQRLTELLGSAAAELWREVDLDALELRQEEMAQVLLETGSKYNFGLPSGAAAGPAQIEAFFRSLQLKDLALAHACALGRERAWQEFIARFREYLTQAATAIAGNNAAGKDLADSLYSEMYGITERGGERRPPLGYYSGRGSLKGFLRATLAQRNVDRHRRLTHEEPLANRQPAASSEPVPQPDLLLRLAAALGVVFGMLAVEERFILTSLYLDQRTLLEISRVLRVHEATVSRRVQRLTTRIRDELLRTLEQSGMSRAAAREALEVDPRDLEINLRTLLQASRSETFLNQVKGSDER